MITIYLAREFSRLEPEHFFNKAIVSGISSVQVGGYKSNPDLDTATPVDKKVFNLDPIPPAMESYKPFQATFTFRLDTEKNFFPVLAAREDGVFFKIEASLRNLIAIFDKASSNFALKKYKNK